MTGALDIIHTYVNTATVVSYRRLIPHVNSLDMWNVIGVITTLHTTFHLQRI